MGLSAERLVADVHARIVDPIQPGGRKKIAQRFIAGYQAQLGKVPQGRKRRGMESVEEIPGMISFAPAGLVF